MVGSVSESENETFQIVNRKIISKSNILAANVYSIDGKLISTIDNNSLNVPFEIKGLVIIEIETEAGVLRQKFVF